MSGPSGYWRDGRWHQGLTLKTGGSFSASALDLEVAAAVARARETGDALTELKRLLQDRPQLRQETPDDVDHPLNPLVAVFVTQRLGGRDQDHLLRTTP